MNPNPKFSPKRSAVAFSFIVLVFALLAIGKFGFVSEAGKQPVVALLLPTSATMTDALAPGGDVDGDGRADPGDTIQYTVTIPNPTVGSGTGMKFTNTITDPNLLFVANSLNTTPIAVDNSYDTIGNTQLQVGASQTVSPSIFVNGNVLSNDIDPDTGSSAGLTAVAQANAATANGGLVTMQTDGTFVYTPPANFTGSDTFTYTATDGTATGSGTVTVNIIGRVRYVKNDAAAPGDGRSHTPFNTLAGGQSATAGDTIYVFQGNGTTGNQSAGITLANNQRLIGAGVALLMPGIIVNGVSNPQILPAATQPQITNTSAGGNGVSIGTSTGVEIQGLNISGHTNAIDATFTGSATGSLTITNNTISTPGVTGAEGIDVNAGSTGSITLAINNNAVSSNGTGIDFNRTAGTLIVASFSANSISGNTVGSGIVMNGVTFDSNTATAGFQTVNAGNQFIGQSGNGVGGGGMNLTNVTGDLSFTDLDIFADNGTALGVTSSGAFSSAASTGFRIQVTANAATLNAVGGAAADITSATIDLQLNAMSSANSAAEGVELDNVAGTFSAPSGSTITNATNAAFLMENGGTANVTYNGTITDDVGSLVTISGQTG
ncbi:MAG TPA: Ig-like domain-containing protein, partial [Pyrinomonadaceae bacterium]|nr:Ig-like domain-containing protein [Pyrinomonadaceae bacterium]